MVEGAGTGGDSAVARGLWERFHRDGQVVSGFVAVEPLPQNPHIPNPKKKKARGASETRRGLKGSLLLEEINANYRVIYKTGKRFLGAMRLIGGDDPMLNSLIVLPDSELKNRLLFVEELFVFGRSVQRSR